MVTGHDRAFIDGLAQHILARPLAPPAPGRLPTQQSLDYSTVPRQALSHFPRAACSEAGAVFSLPLFVGLTDEPPLRRAHSVRTCGQVFEGNGKVRDHLGTFSELRKEQKDSANRAAREATREASKQAEAASKQAEAVAAWAAVVTADVPAKPAAVTPAGQAKATTAAPRDAVRARFPPFGFARLFTAHTAAL